jgi:hypothetical protein
VDENGDDFDPSDFPGSKIRVREEEDGRLRVIEIERPRPRLVRGVPPG